MNSVHLSHPNQEAGIQIILRDGNDVKPVGYWPIDLKPNKHGGYYPVSLQGNKMKRKF